jgi:hypothetical protein
MPSLYSTVESNQIKTIETSIGLQGGQRLVTGRWSGYPQKPFLITFYEVVAFPSKISRCPVHCKLVILDRTKLILFICIKTSLPSTAKLQQKRSK